jgi:hypothetical protein
MELQNALTACQAMEPIHVLRDEYELGKVTFNFNQRVVGSVGLAGANQPATPIVPLPHEFGV